MSFLSIYIYIVEFPIFWIVFQQANVQSINAAVRLVSGDISSVVSDIKWSYIGILVSCDSDELRFWEGESLDSSWLVGVFCPILVYFHHMEPGLVLVERLKNHHLEIQLKTFVRLWISKFGKMIWEKK